MFLELAIGCASVIFCCSSPKQKVLVSFAIFPSIEKMYFFACYFCFLYLSRLGFTCELLDLPRNENDIHLHCYAYWTKLSFVSWSIEIGYMNPFSPFCFRAIYSTHLSQILIRRRFYPTQSSQIFSERKILFDQKETLLLDYVYSH